MAKMVWDEQHVRHCLLQSAHAREFARICTPHGLRTVLTTHFNRQLECHCFVNALVLAASKPDKFWYCEGFASGVPHAWVSLKTIKDQPADEDWCLDVTWPWKSKHYAKPSDKLTYAGFRYCGLEAKTFLLSRSKHCKTSTSLLKYVDETMHLVR